MKEHYLQINKELWNKKTEIHLNSEFYFLEDFKKGKNSLNGIELELLGDVKGKSILHLQCHFGQDSISLSRLGAEVTAVDFSEQAISKARELAMELQVNTEFICCDIYSLPQFLNKQFDIVFTSYGTIGWLPNIMEWGKIVSRYLKPKAAFIFAEFHPVVWMYDNNFEEVFYSYFNTSEIIETETGTYADRNAEISTTSITWNHSISEVLDCLLSNGLTLKEFKEFDYSPYNCMAGMEEFEPNKFRIKKFQNKIPLVYALKAIS